MTRTNDELNKINSKLDKIDHKLNGPSVVDQAGEAAINLIGNTIQDTVPKACFTGRSLRARWPKCVNYVLDVAAIFLILISFLIMVSNHILGGLGLVIGFMLLSTSTNKHIR